MPKAWLDGESVSVLPASPGVANPVEGPIRLVPGCPGMGQRLHGTHPLSSRYGPSGASVRPPNKPSWEIVTGCGCAVPKVPILRSGTHLQKQLPFSQVYKRAILVGASCRCQGADRGTPHLQEGAQLKIGQWWSKRFTQRTQLLSLSHVLYLHPSPSHQRRNRN